MSYYTNPYRSVKGFLFFTLFERVGKRWSDFEDPLGNHRKRGSYLPREAKAALSASIRSYIVNNILSFPQSSHYAYRAGHFSGVLQYLLRTFFLSQTSYTHPMPTILFSDTFRANGISFHFPSRPPNGGAGRRDTRARFTFLPASGIENNDNDAPRPVYYLSR